MMRSPERDLNSRACDRAQWRDGIVRSARQAAASRRLGGLLGP
jgi:hypothetical protein